MRLGKYTLTVRRTKNLTLLICDEKQSHALVSKFIYFTENTERKPLVITKEIADKYRLIQQAKRDLKAGRDKSVVEPLFTTAFELSLSNNANGKHPYWISQEMYWYGYARGIREQRQSQREHQEKQSNIGSLTGNDIADLAQTLGIDINKLNTAVLGLTASRKAV